MKTARRLLCPIAGLLLASCVAHGAGGPGVIPDQGNYRSHSASFYEELLSGRVWIFRKPARRTYRNVPHFMIFRSDGRRLRCTGRWTTRYKLDYIGDELARWSIVRKGPGAVVRYDYENGKSTYGHFFYDSAIGTLGVDLLHGNATGWTRGATGWVQDSLPRALADICPGFDLPDGMRINEKQTSLRMDDLRRQDPDAPIRNFPGSHLTAPGRTGLGASGGRPTTTKAEVEAFLAAQHGAVLINSKRIGFVYVRVEGREELWRIGNASMADGFWDIVRTKTAAGEWIEVREGSKVRRRYLIGYPFPYLPTGHRHPAFQLTDEFLANPYPRALPHMGEAYADKRFVFHPKGTFSVVDEAGNQVDGPHSDGLWRWTKGRLEMTVSDDPTGPRRVHWRTLAHRLGMKPTVWTPSTPDKYASTASATTSTSGTARCTGDYEGTATWTLGEDGKKVWDISGCSKAD